jgi:ribosome-binding factor A
MVRFRRERLGDQLRVELADLILQEVRDPRVGFVTVTEVRMSRDLQYARVYVSIFGDEEQTRESFAALERAGGFLRSQVGRRLKLRRVPELRFALDETLDNSARLDALLEGTGDTEDG